MVELRYETGEDSHGGRALWIWVVLDDDAFQGGYSAPRSYRGRTARWLYGANSAYGQMTAT